MASQAAPFSLSLSSRILSPKFPLLPSSSRSFSSFPKFLSPKFPSLHCDPQHPQMKSSTKSPRFSVSASTKPISVGDPIPDATLSYFDSSSDELKTVTVSELTKGKKTVLFAVPGAFTPTCSQKHVPGFIAKSGELKSKGVDVVACVSVNDAFVMKAWKKDLGVGGDEVLFLSDGNGEFTRKLGVELDLSDKPVGLGVRSRRYALLAEDGVVKVLNLEEGGAFEVSSAEEMLNAL